MMSKPMRFGGVAAMMAVAAMVAACEQGPQAIDTQAPTMSLSTTDGSILVGETTTVMAQTGNLLGREVEIDWNASMGSIEPTEQGRMARFTSDSPGTAVITAELNVDGRIVRDQINVTINSME